MLDEAVETPESRSSLEEADFSEVLWLDSSLKDDDDDPELLTGLFFVLLSFLDFLTAISLSLEEDEEDEEEDDDDDEDSDDEEDDEEDDEDDEDEEDDDEEEEEEEGGLELLSLSSRCLLRFPFIFFAGCRDKSSSELSSLALRFKAPEEALNAFSVTAAALESCEARPWLGLAMEGREPSLESLSFLLELGEVWFASKTSSEGMPDLARVVFREAQVLLFSSTSKASDVVAKAWSLQNFLTNAHANSSSGDWTADEGARGAMMGWEL